ncbi:MAG: hypothetical protein IPP88_02025 [Betaproteobacteria bacterium]|nr:hypothetical protein [Betaproteobacteria bacterium]
MAKYIMWVLWPSFIAAGMGVGILFTLVDPSELVILGNPVHVSKTAVYTLGFFVLWAICSAASALSCFLQATSREGS